MPQQYQRTFIFRLTIWSKSIICYTDLGSLRSKWREEVDVVIGADSSLQTN